FIAALSGGAVVLAVRLIGHLLVFRDDSFPEAVYVPQLSPWLLLVPALWIAGWLGGDRFAASPLSSMAFTLTGAVSLVLTAAMAVEFLATHSPYVAYHLGSPKLALHRGVATLGTVSAALFLDRVVTRSRTTLALALAAASLGLLFFVRTNYVHAHSSMVRAIVSLDRRSGEVQWIRAALHGPQPPIDGRNSPATPTPVTDGRLVCGYFGTAGLMCVTSEGLLAWT